MTIKYSTSQTFHAFYHFQGIHRKTHGRLGHQKAWLKNKSDYNSQTDSNFEVNLIYRKALITIQAYIAVCSFCKVKGGNRKTRISNKFEGSSWMIGRRSSPAKCNPKLNSVEVNAAAMRIKRSGNFGELPRSSSFLIASMHREMRDEIWLPLMLNNNQSAP